MVGQSLGAGDDRRAERCGYISYQLSGMVMTLMGLAFVLIPGSFIRLFTNDPAMIETAAVPLRITGAVQPLLAAAIVFPGCLRGAGDTRFPMVLNLISIWAIRVPVALLLGRTLGLGLAGAWIGIALDVAARGIVTLIRFRGGRWKLIQV
jgi:MATE family multidrug resistance protein